MRFKWCHKKYMDYNAIVGDLGFDYLEAEIADIHWFIGTCERACINPSVVLQSVQSRYTAP